MVINELDIKYRRKRQLVNHDKLFDVIVATIMILIAALFLLPLLYVLSCSFTDAETVLTGNAHIIPVNFDPSGYKDVLNNKAIWTGLRNTVLYTAIGTAIQVSVQLLAAYPLSRRDFKPRKVINFFFVLTMFIGGGMIPNFLLISQLGLLDTMWAIILPSTCSVFSIIVVCTYMSNSIPYELQEAARVDGCGDFGIFMRIIVPLARPVIFITTLYALVAFWNSYFSSLIYLSNPELYPLQRAIQDILIPDKAGVGGITPADQERLKYVTIVVSSLPLLIIYPFFEKYFEKGTTIGGMKG